MNEQQNIIHKYASDTNTDKKQDFQYLSNKFIHNNEESNPSDK